MSFPTTIYLTNAEVKATTVVKALPLGIRGVASDGRVFRYAQAGATALSPFKIVRSATLGPWSTMSACGVQDPVRRVTSYLAGAKSIKWSMGATGAAAANLFEDGYLIVGSTDTAETQMARIGTHNALASATILNSDNEISIPEGLDLDLSTETDVMPRLIPNAYKHVIIASELPPGGVVGVPVINVPINYYFWLQTWGPCLVLEDVSGRADSNLYHQGLQAYIATGGTGAVGLPSSGMTGSLDSDSQGCVLIGAIGVYMNNPQKDTAYGLINLRLAA